MKKILLFMFAVFCIIITTSEKNRHSYAGQVSAKPVVSVHSNTKPFFADTYALDGTTKTEASTMVDYCTDTYYVPTDHYCVWFSKPVLKSYCDVVDKLAGGDGIRFYFAKNSQTDNNYTLIPVATIAKGVDMCSPTQPFHADSFLSAKPRMSVGDISKTDPMGATFFTTTPCPLEQDTCKNSNHYIGCDDATTFIKNPVYEKINAKSEWFSTKLIRFLISKTTNLGGIRFYFGKHKKYSSCDNTPRHGVIMMVTDGSKVQKDKLICIPDDFNKTHNWFTGGGADNGEQCKPNCQGVTLPLTPPL